MFPDYRRTAEQRQHRAIQILIPGLIAVVVAFWGTVLYVLWHFAEKFW